jgi:hypothetical protein
MLLLLSYYCYCSLTSATTLYYTPFLSFACFAVQLLLPDYYYSTFLYLLLCYVSISLFPGLTKLLFSGYSSMLRVVLRGRFEIAKGLNIGQGRCLLCLLSPSLLLSGACCACSLHLWCCLVLVVLPLSLSRAASANTRDGVFVLLRSGFWWDDKDGVQIQKHASC